MRFFEFEGDGVDKLIMVLRNYIGRASSKKAPAKLNWAGINKVIQTSGFELGTDYETFKAMYDASPAIQQMVKNFNASGIELNVPGAPDAEKPQQDGETSQEKLDKAAASAAPAQMAQANQTAPAQDLT
jgi:hypothetical protein